MKNMFLEEYNSTHMGTKERKMECVNSKNIYIIIIKLPFNVPTICIGILT